MSEEKAFETQLEALSQLESLKREAEDLIFVKNSNSGDKIKAFRKENEKLKSALKSDVKKTSAFVKKLKSINAEGIQQCIRDTETLNLSLYISEIIAAIAETNYKATDVPSMIRLSICLHRRYEEFTSGLILNIKSIFSTPANDDDKEFGKKKRILIRFVVELFQVGVWSDESFFVELVRSLLGKSKL